MKKLPAEQPLYGMSVYQNTDASFVSREAMAGLFHALKQPRPNWHLRLDSS